MGVVEAVFPVASVTPALPWLSLTAPLLGPPVNPCELHCRPSNEYFAEKLRDAVVDGTPCYQGQASRDLCINGICKVCPARKRVSSTALPNPLAGLLWLPPASLWPPSPGCTIGLPRSASEAL